MLDFLQIIATMMANIPEPTSPTSADAVASYKETVVDQEFLHKAEDAVTCCICLEDYMVTENILELPCIHTYHSACIKEWLSTHHTCQKS